MDLRASSRDAAKCQTETLSSSPSLSARAAPMMASNAECLISVIMPTYGHARFISRAIQSLFDQTYSNWELIVVDDASPDATRDAISPWLMECRVRYERLPSNRGLGAALNQGLNLASGEFIAYLP